MAVTGALTGNPLGRQDATGPAAVTPPAVNTDELAVEALAALGYAPTKQAANTQNGLRQPRDGVFFEGFDADLSMTVYQPAVGNPMPAGRYYLSATCSGEGGFTINWAAPQGVTGKSEFECGAIGSAPFTTTADGPITLYISPNDAARGRSGFALELSDALVVGATGLLAEQPTANHLFGAAGLLENDVPRTDVDETEHGVNTYKLTFVCAGQGDVWVDFSGGEDGKGSLVHCTEEGYVHVETLVPRAAGAPLSVSAELRTPGARIGYAYRVEQI
ncbi:hypothetical protein GCM10009682_46730 [Luedemannella flava]|uniref:Uncharacterized protein n=1 Tax=Luedemannella flava TaxID=349316 RepID=A0ABP4YSE5_9ACTN